ncbi:MAG: DUF2232 domain-containing protein [Gammaproteobacteria bacterium]|nr:DUF2232 domain-containing protein [Gammaproteobacteria bacterium]
MGALAAYIMRGRWQAILSAVALALVSLMLMPLSWPLSFLSAATVGLVTLIQGQREGALCLVGASLLMGLLGMLFLQTPVPAIGFALLVWFPAWFLAMVLGKTVSLSSSILLSSVLGMIVIVAFFGALESPSEWWFTLYVDVLIPALEKAGVVLEDKEALMAALQHSSQLMTGTVAAMWVAGAYLGLMLARRWQALLFNPGGFQKEFHELRLGKAAALFALLVMGVSFSGLGVMSEVALSLLQVMLMIFLLQGLAVGHALIKVYTENTAWLVAMYVMLIFVIPYALMLYAVAGVADNWIDFRQRFVKSD